jgi:hypothetical protein
VQYLVIRILDFLRHSSFGFRHFTVPTPAP